MASKKRTGKDLKGHTKDGGGWWGSVLHRALETAEGLPPLLRFVIVFAVLIVVVALSGRAVPDNLVFLLYILAIGGAGAYLWYELRLGPSKPQPRQGEEPPPPACPIETPPPPAAEPTGAPAPQKDAAPQPEQSSTPEEVRERYCRELLRTCNRLLLNTIDRKASQPEAAELELSEVFTSLDVTGGSIDDQELREESAERLERRADRMPATAAVCKWDKLVLLGDPGSGKSTFASFLSVCLAADWLGLSEINASRLGEGWSLPRLLPVRIVLREYAAEALVNGKGLWDFIAGRLSSKRPGGTDLSAFAGPLKQQLKAQGGGLLILDGLDEVPEANRMREELRDAVLGFCDEFAHCRVLVTARPYAYQRDEWRLTGFEVKRLADFDEEQIESFIERWYAHVAAKDPSLGRDNARRYTEQLKTATKENERLKELAPRPLLLTLMASLHRWRGGGTLPEKRQELYEEAVKLLLDLWQRPKTQFDADGKPAEPEYDVFTELGISQDGLRDALERVAYEVHGEQPVLTGVANVSVDRLAGALYQASERKESCNIARVTSYVTDRAGLLVERVPQQEYAFPHRTFQEYLAACHLADDDFPYKLAEHVRDDDERWREVALLAAAKAVGGSAGAIWNVIDAFCPDELQTRSAYSRSRFYLALRAAQALIETEQYREVPVRQENLSRRLKAWIETLCRSSDAFPPPDRAAAGRALAVLGDPRPGVGTRADAENVPDILWREVPGGTLMMGSSKDDEEAGKSEYGPDGKRFPVAIKPFRLAAYPVTYAQFQPFVAGDGYENPDYWTKDGWAWKEKQGLTEPALWDDRKWNVANHPVVGVTWYEAVAYCGWLTRRLREFEELKPGEAVRLPTEAEWEWAARGPNAHRYPWGDERSEQACNDSDAGIGQTCAVGIFPRDGSRWLADQGQPVHDLAGNVMDWCSTKWRESYDQEPDESLEGDSRRVLRGGSWSWDRGVRCASRSGLRPVGRDDDLGFRCAR